MDYPENCIKGVPNDDFIVEGRIASHLFYFNSRDSRADGWTEHSINWQDDEKAVEITLEQEKDGVIQFKSGVAIVPRSELDHIQAIYKFMNLLSYERQKLKDNDYHGNILLNNNYVGTKLEQRVASTIALYSEFVPRNKP